MKGVRQQVLATKLAGGRRPALCGNGRMGKAAKPAGPAPTVASLNEAAISHLSRYAMTEAGLVRVLERRVQRWAGIAALEGQEITLIVSRARAAARDVARSMVKQGYINDALFASTRAARLARSGRSHRAVAAHLAEMGVSAETTRAALPEPEREISAAIAYARRRRLGPFRIASDKDTGSPDDQRRELRAFARAGFPRDVAERALRMSREMADTLLFSFTPG